MISESPFEYFTGLVKFLVALLLTIIFFIKDIYIAAGDIESNQSKLNKIWEAFKKNYIKFFLSLIGLFMGFLIVGCGLFYYKKNLNYELQHQKDLKKIDFQTNKSDSLEYVIDYKLTIDSFAMMKKFDSEKITELTSDFKKLEGDIPSIVWKAVNEAEKKGKATQDKAVSDALAQFKLDNEAVINKMKGDQRKYLDSLVDKYVIKPVKVTQYNIKPWSANRLKRNKNAGRNKNYIATSADDIVEITTSFTINRLPEKKDFFLITVYNNDMQISAQRAEFDKNSLVTLYNYFPVSKSIDGGILKAILTNHSDTIKMIDYPIVD